MSNTRKGLARTDEIGAEPEATFGVDAATLKWWREAPSVPLAPGETAQERMDKLYAAMVEVLR